MNSEQQDVQVEESEVATEEKMTAETEQPQENQEQTTVSDDLLDAKVAELEIELSKAYAQIADQKDSVVRAAAEVDNIRRRAAIDVDKAKKFALEKFVSELLPVLDNMERALEFADKENESLKPVLEGIELTQKTLLSVMEKFDVKMIDPQGETFNPEFHQAMSMQPSADVAPNTVMAVMQKGYELNGRLVRPAMVMVSKAAE
ncbi:nucleotide exchange factor GrpE [Algicola sagamiensis]|uniref:nucleotide exchange factor GrpE n=1 Tax=Algicola sagamiensis TaxID=163869 RepID=UPI000370CB95|nr:nucleotide exchange factor GrpE [Algicola sagamiensis]